MALGALKHRNIAEIDWMLEGFIGFVTGLAFAVGQRAQIHRMLKGTCFDIALRWRSGVIDHRVANIAIAADDFSGIAHVFAVVTTKTTREVQVADVVWMRLPIGFHLREKIRLEESLNLFNRTVHRGTLSGINVGILSLIEIIQSGSDSINRFGRSRIRLT